MLYTIENEALLVTICDRGAEIVSIIDRASGTEYLWQGDPAYWTGHAYNLFPICGRLTEGKYTWHGKTYEMNLHGFARKTDFAVLSQEKERIVFALTANHETRAVYPFKFELRLTYSLEGATVRTDFSVDNRGAETMPFAVGAHPGFNVPLTPGECFSDYYLEFDTPVPDLRYFVLSETCFLTHTEPAPFAGIVDGRRIALRHDLFDQDAVFFSNPAKQVTLRSTKSSRAVTVAYPDMQYLGIWHAPKTEAPYVCIEPWYSMPAYDGEIDDLETKRDMIHLPAGEHYANSFTITIA